MKEINIAINNDEIGIKSKGDIDLYDIFITIFALVDLGVEADPNFKKEIIKYLKENK